MPKRRREWKEEEEEEEVGGAPPPPFFKRRIRGGNCRLGRREGRGFFGKEIEIAKGGGGGCYSVQQEEEEGLDNGDPRLVWGKRRG